MPRMTREEAEARTRQQTAVFQRIDRLASKLTTWGAVVDASGDGVNTVAREAQVWVVAVSGTYRARSAPAGITPPEFRWGIVVYDAETGNGLSSGGGPDGDWPPYFDRLPDGSR